MGDMGERLIRTGHGEHTHIHTHTPSLLKENGSPRMKILRVKKQEEDRRQMWMKVLVLKTERLRKLT